MGELTAFWGAFDGVDATPSDECASKDGVHDPRKMVETFAYSESRHLDLLESRSDAA
jgi:hypothetical protein